MCPTRGHPLLKTSVVRRTFPYSGVRPLDSLVSAIEATKPQIVIPCDDRAVEHLHELYARSRNLGQPGRDIAALIERSLGSPESFPIVSSRIDLLRIAREEGLRVADTNLINAAEDLRSWSARQKLPWVLKADGTAGGRGVKIAGTAGQAQKYFMELSGLFGSARAIKRLIINRDPFWLRPWWNGTRPPVIVQSYIHGRPANCAVACWDGRVLAGIGVEVVNTAGPTEPANIVRVVDSPEMMFAAERIARRLRLSGLFGLDFMINESGEAYLIELNPRATPLCHLQLGQGRDMIGALWAQLSGQPVREIPPITQNEVIAYFPQASKCQSEFLKSTFYDIPQGEPDLIQELLSPWPDRTLLVQACNRADTALRTLRGLLTPFGINNVDKASLTYTALPASVATDGEVPHQSAAKTTCP